MDYKKFKDAVDSLVSWGFMDPYEAMVNPNYLAYCLRVYFEAQDIVKEILHIK